MKPTDTTAAVEGGIASKGLSRRELLFSALLVIAGSPQAAQTTTYPDHAVKFVNWSNPGGNLDVVGRLLADQASRRWGQPVITDNKIGASGIIATDFVAKSPADGYTVLITSSTGQITNTLVRLKLPYDPVKDFEPLSLLVAGNIALIANGNAPFSNLKELVAYAKTQNKGLTYGSWGIGTSAHLFGELLRRQADLNLIHVPYKGGELGAMSDVIGGNLDLSFMTQGNAKIQSRGGRLKLIAITGPNRHKSLPDTPTFGEQGFAGFGVAGWIGAYVPAGTPKPIVARIAATMHDVMQQPDVASKLEELGYEVIGSTPEEFKAFYKDDLAHWTEMVKSAGITPE
jgi:tripartite-type tricarboxylate transporter receptor subunit TctC